MEANLLCGPSATRKYDYYANRPCQLTTVRTGYGNHGDYVFGWKDDALQKILDEECYVNCKTMRTQSIDEMNSCKVAQTVDEDIGDTNCMLATTFDPWNANQEC